MTNINESIRFEKPVLHNGHSQMLVLKTSSPQCIMKSTSIPKYVHNEKPVLHSEYYGKLNSSLFMLHNRHNDGLILQICT